jgi:hypothetical protein
MLTRKLLINSPILRQQAVELSIRSDHAAFREICIQTQAPHRPEQTPHRNFLLSICLGANGQHTPAVFTVGFLFLASVDVDIRTEPDDHVFGTGCGREPTASVFFGSCRGQEQGCCVGEAQTLRLKFVIDGDGERAVVFGHVD